MRVPVILAMAASAMAKDLNIFFADVNSQEVSIYNPNDFTILAQDIEIKVTPVEGDQYTLPLVEFGDDDSYTPPIYYEEREAWIPKSRIIIDEINYDSNTISSRPFLEAIKDLTAADAKIKFIDLYHFGSRVDRLDSNIGRFVSSKDGSARRLPTVCVGSGDFKAQEWFHAKGRLNDGRFFDGIETREYDSSEPGYVAPFCTDEPLSKTDLEFKESSDAILKLRRELADLEYGQLERVSEENLFISEVGHSEGHRHITLYNPNTVSSRQGTFSYRILIQKNGNLKTREEFQNVVNKGVNVGRFNTRVRTDETFTVCSSGMPQANERCDLIDDALTDFGTNDAVFLIKDKNNEVIDIIGGFTKSSKPFYGCGERSILENRLLMRRSNVCTGNPTPWASFGPCEWSVTQYEEPPLRKEGHDEYKSLRIAKTQRNVCGLKRFPFYYVK